MKMDIVLVNHARANWRNFFRDYKILCDNHRFISRK